MAMTGGAAAADVADHPFRSLAEALRIPGARRIALIAEGSTSPLWSAAPGGPGEPVEGAAMVAVVLAQAGRELLRLTGGGEFDDVLLTGGEHFHLLRLVERPGEVSEIVHLTLARSGANLALARHELRALVNVYRAGPPALPPAPGREPEPVPCVEGEAFPEGVILPEAVPFAGDVAFPEGAVLSGAVPSPEGSAFADGAMPPEPAPLPGDSAFAGSAPIAELIPESAPVPAPGASVPAVPLLPDPSTPDDRTFPDDVVPDDVVPDDAVPDDAVPPETASTEIPPPERESGTQPSTPALPIDAFDAVLAERAADRSVNGVAAQEPDFPEGEVIPAGSRELPAGPEPQQLTGPSIELAVARPPSRGGSHRAPEEDQDPAAVRPQLPRRSARTTPAAPPEPVPPIRVLPDEHGVPSLFSLLNQPFTNDDPTLDRIAAALREL